MDFARLNLALHRSRKDPDPPQTISARVRRTALQPYYQACEVPGAERACERAYEHLTAGALLSDAIEELEAEIRDLERHIRFTPLAKLHSDIGRRPRLHEFTPDDPKLTPEQRLHLQRKHRGIALSSWLQQRTKLQEQYAQTARERLQAYHQSRAQLRQARRRLQALLRRQSAPPTLTERQLVIICGSRPAARAAIYIMCVRFELTQLPFNTPQGQPIYGPATPPLRRRPGGKGTPSPIALAISKLKVGEVLPLATAPGQLLRNRPPSWLRRKFPRRRYKLTRKPHTIQRLEDAANGR